MNDNLVTVTCPSSTLHAIIDALNWAQHQANARAEAIMHLEALHNDNPKIPAYAIDTIDDVEHYRRDEKQYTEACELAFRLWCTSRDVTDPEEIAFYQWKQGVPMSELVPF